MSNFQISSTNGLVWGNKSANAQSVAAKIGAGATYENNLLTLEGVYFVNEVGNEHVINAAGERIPIASFFTWEHTVTSNTLAMVLSDYATANGWDGDSEIQLTVDTGVYVYGSSTLNPGIKIPSSLTVPVTIINKGYIIGAGGFGADATNGPITIPANGGAAIINEANSNLTVINQSGAYIAGGGGGGHKGSYSGGGGGAGGGWGGRGWRSSQGLYAQAVGGQPGFAGANAPAVYSGGTNGGGGQGGGAGGGGGGGSTWYDPSYGGGGGGGRILPGTGGAGGSGDPSGPIYGGAGGAAGSVGSNGSSGGGGGGGGWGANGGNSFSSGGAAISSTPSYTLSNSGTIYGAV